MTALKQRALFIFEASPALGGGHASRSLALARAVSRNTDVGLAVSQASLAMLGEAERDVVAVFEDGRPHDVVAALCEDGVAVPELIVLDHYALDFEAEVRLRDRGAKVVVIDDLANRAHAAGLLIDSNPARSAGDYKSLVGDTCGLLLGADYALLRPEFRRARLAGARRTENVGRPVRLLVSMGATDPANATAMVLSALEMVTTPIEVTVVLGRGAPHAEGIAARLPTLRCRAKLVAAQDDMAVLYLDHDVAIGAPATSALERACTGLASLLIETAANQSDLGRGLDMAGAAVLIGRHDALQPHAIAHALAELLEEPLRLQRLRTAGFALVDGLGAERTAANLQLAFATRDGRRLGGRRLKSSDAETVLRWQSATGARRFARNPLTPTEADHRRWIESRLAVTPAITEIITLDSEPAAMTRLDPRAGYNEVSILVAPEFQGNGIGEAAVHYLETFAGELPATAFVHPANTASLNLFRKCGYGHTPDRRLQILGTAHQGVSG